MQLNQTENIFASSRLCVRNSYSSLLDRQAWVGGPLLPRAGVLDHVVVTDQPHGERHVGRTAHAGLAISYDLGALGDAALLECFFELLGGLEGVHLVREL